MLRALVFVVIITAAGAGQTSLCQAASKTIGNWVVVGDGDPSSNKTISAKITDNGKGSLTIRCARPGGLGVSVEVESSKSYAPEAAVKLASQADQDAPAEQSAKAVGPTSVLVSDPREIVRDALRARTLRVQLQSPEGNTADLTFAPAGAGQALTQIMLDCPTDMPASR